MRFTDRREGETQLAYQKRLLYAKLVYKTLDIGYTELADLVYGRPYAPDVARRMAYGSVRTFQLLDKEAENTFSADSLMNELEQKRIELNKERIRLTDKKREYSRLISVEAREERMHEVIRELAERLADMPCIGDAETPYHHHCDGEKEAVLVLSDWHYGMVTDNAYNKYDTASCAARASLIAVKARNAIKLNQCSKLHVVVLGDMIHGAIHTSTRLEAKELVADQLMHVSELLSRIIMSLALVVPETEVYVTYGNHGRTIQNKNDSAHRDNLERLVPWWLEERLKGVQNVSIHSSEDEFLRVDAAGHMIVGVHGDLDSARQSVRVLPMLFAKSMERIPEYILLGDKHHRESVEELGVTAVVCGSLCGSDNYANEKRLFSTPEQLMLIVDKDYGVEAEYHLRAE